MPITTTLPPPAPILCDSCLKPATPDHIRERMARLELATRYRPVHIGLLLVCTAPPSNLADDLYAPSGADQEAGDPPAAARSSDARAYLETLLLSVGVPAGKTPSEQLADFQRRGIYLARLVECPLPKDVPLDSLAAQYGPVLIKRITHSYKPRMIALLAPVAPGLAEMLRAAGFSGRLIADGQGIEITAPGDSGGLAHVQALLSHVTGSTDSA